MGPLAGIKILELAGIGPGPFCAMLLADLGATVLRIDRPEPPELGIPRPLQYNPVLRGRRAIALDLKRPEARDLALRLVARSDALIEGFRPGVTERLGLGPDDCLARNPRLIYGRMTGWGQQGPLAPAAGHDLNYIALTGALASIGRAGQAPAPPLNLVGDYAGGALYLALGILAAIIAARGSGQGQVVDAAIVDGTAHLMTGFHGLLAAGMLNPERGTNLLDSGAPFYDCYACADGRWISVAPIEGRFHAELLRILGIDAAEFPPQSDRARWPEARARLAATFLTRTRDAWCALLEGTDACVAPVLTMEEATRHPHMRARGTYIEVDGVVQPAPAPRFSRTVPDVPSPPQAADPADAEAVLEGWLEAEEIARLRAAGAFG
ncbi:CaiB/BaiF CoA transferase family protein [Plastoroseomonas hellenica]|uniref:CaiB/BaiF CoA transferase family protein n=1 Tax=Plastoroseomonas hellenica TaxID=2687306 RepID=UPI001BAD0C42|nr:CaiB/BaiF CoA-transferase family protein [Plastoroseomonas hellenica]MBR0641698.1 CoA transferase [Plastoroseomonas hellenica]